MLTLAGDVNLDGKVDAADLQDSISQLGTNPQAVGVMPIADANNDNIIDAADIQVVMDGYGGATDVYEGLWDGSRLLSIAAGSAGFGSLAGVGAVGGGTQFGGGPRPKDDCYHIVLPGDLPNTILPSLLRTDAAGNCGECPECDDPPGDCYECGSPGTLSGGEVSVEPSQPKTGEEITWTVTPIEISGGTRQCKSDCGDEGTECSLDDRTIQPAWVLLKRDATDVDWVPVYPGAYIVEGNGPWTIRYTTSVPCRELKLLTVENQYGAGSDCEPLEYASQEAEVQVADFTLCYATNNPNPAGVVSRTRIGIGESVTIQSVEGVAVNWTITRSDGSGSVTSGPSVAYTLDAGYAQQTTSIIVEAEYNGCVRTEVFTVVSPSGVRYEHQSQYDSHIQNSPSGYLRFCITVLPEDVSFAGLEVGEQHLDEYDSGSGVFLHAHPGQPAWVTNDHSEWQLPLQDDNTVPGTDSSDLALSPTTWLLFRTEGHLEATNTLERSIPVFYVNPDIPDDNDPTNGDDEKEVEFATVVSIKLLYQNGDVRLTKFGAQRDFEISDGTLNYPPSPDTYSVCYSAGV